MLRAKTGRLTRELLREPGRFGLGQLPVVNQPDRTTTAVCGYCSTGCGLNIHLQDGPNGEPGGGGAVNLTPTTEYPVNLGMACPKGWEALAVLDAPDRAVAPLLKDGHGKQKPVNWDQALDTFRDRFQAIQKEHGAESVAFLSTGQIPTEEMALLGAVAKFGMGLVHGDGNTRQCMATAAVAYKQSVGFDAPPYTYADFEESDCLIFVGANPCLAHPIMWERVMRNKQKPEILVLDPRATETAMNATLHLPAKPKSDQSFFYGLANYFIQNGWVDRDFVANHTAGFEEYARFVEAFTFERVSKETGLPAETLRDAALRIRARERVSAWWTMGVNQSHQGTRTAQAIINFQLLTGSFGKPGTGANSITGQCNAMGSRLFSNTTGLLGGRDFKKAADRAAVAGMLNVPEERIPDRDSLAYPEIIEGILKGKIRGLWVIATNPAHSWINRNQLDDVLSRLDFLVVQDMYHSTETAKIADLVLPAAGWGEKDGTVINSERRIGLLKKVRKAPGQALADFSIFKLIADRWGCGELFEEWTDPEAAFHILKRLSAGMPCDFSGIRDYRHLDEAGGVQWPYPAEGADPAVERRLFADGRFYHADGRAKFLFEEPRPLPEAAGGKYPFTLLTGRGSASQWHTQTRTSKSAVLRKLYPDSVYVEVHVRDARRLQIAPEQTVRVESQRGSIRAKAFVTNGVPEGCLFLPMHYPETNQLTDGQFDPYSRQPAYKACAARLLADAN
ncbi:molybdopterin oxidoreductase family protein [Alienimonas chondri]